MHTLGEQKRGPNGLFAAFGIFGVGVATFPLMVAYSRIAGLREAFGLVLSPAPAAILGALLVLDFLYIRANYAKIRSYLDDPRPDALDGAQRTLIGFPRRIIAFSMVLTLLSFQLVLFFVPGLSDRRAEFLVLSFANVIFVGIPLYIVFFQRIERWASPIPYTAKYSALQLSARITIVVCFSILASSSFLLVVARETARGAVDPEVLLSDLSARGIPLIAFSLAVGVYNVAMIMRGVAYRIADANTFAFQLGEGNLSGARFAVVPRDELGTLSNGLNVVRDKIGGLIGLHEGYCGPGGGRQG